MVLLFINAVYLSKKCSVIHEIKVIDIAILTWAFGRNSRPYDLQPYKFKIDYWQSFISTAPALAMASSVMRNPNSC